ncbi:hypothetical protein APS56_08735 [Pseudalgibacter alginicilyticus]|uniref:YdhG-like domain-containing protein n=1 Tax=Pseudalgibacter alginicilyticus TaxID=1736674 RepID=A0A0P0DAV9_9FLAO|nr:DUF1801 domain-containing protein [Pseudalgibacter alginicilyticus]ALJ05203.1 hypothetical protein APS56_08735 [Pseudalgibacter alginicilyticus]
MSFQNNFYTNQQEPNKSCLLAMRDIVLNYDQNITETKKYGMPCFCYKNKMFCYLWVDKKNNAPYFLMVEGNRLKHPKLETGHRSRMKILRVDPEKDLPITSIDLIMNQALDLYKLGIIKTRSTI